MKSESKLCKENAKEITFLWIDIKTFHEKLKALYIDSFQK